MSSYKCMFVCIAVMALSLVASGSRRRNEGRNGKFLAFNSDDGEVSIELDFSIPFVKIPVKRAMESFGTGGLDFPFVNINVAALAIGGAMVVGTAIILPLIIKSHAGSSPYKEYGRILENVEFGSDMVLNMANQLMTDNSSVNRCMLKTACYSAQTSEYNTKKLVEQIMSNTLLSSMMNTTAIEDAIDTGIHGGDCLKYSCPLREQQIEMLLNSVRRVGAQ